MDEETPKKDPKKLILDEFELGKPIFESYKNFCKKMRSNFLDYPEFEFWWMRFSVGNFDLDYDRSQDQKYRTIEDIPVQIFEKICGNLEDDWYENKYWFTLRHVCESFRNIVDSWTPPKFVSIEILSLGEKTIRLRFEGFEISYTEKYGNLSEIGFKHHPKSLQHGNFRDLAIGDLTKILALPEDYKLGDLTISDGIDNVFAQKLLETFKNLPNKIHVNNVELKLSGRNTAPVIDIINLCQSIKTFEISPYGSLDEKLTDELNGITSLKNAEMVTIHHDRYDEGYLDPTRLNIPRMTLNHDGGRVDNFLRLVKALLKSPHLKYCHVIGLVRRSKTFENGLNKLGVSNDPPNSDIYRCPIPKSAEFFEITFIRGERNPIRRRRVKHTTFSDTYIERKSNLVIDEIWLS
ncbi:unnamed protein product [Caenorhabditis nigoni]